MKFRIVLFVILFSKQLAVAQQGVNNIWLLGYDGGYGETRINFFSGLPVIDSFPIPMDFRHTLATISDDQGNLLFYTNGAYIADASHDTMSNGSGLNPGAYANFVPDGFLIPQGALIIKKPGTNSLYYLFHNTLDNYPAIGAFAYRLYLTTIDMSMNGGLGSVISKNMPILIDTLNTGKLTACRHANGRDWWVICHRVNSNKYHKLLVTPYGLPTVSDQSIGSVRTWDAGQAKFSSDGSKFAYYHYFNGLDIMDFDRCTGQFSNSVSDTTLPYIQGNVGCEFSPNSQLLYVTNILKVYQYDVTASNPLTTRTEVAIWDSFAQPGIPQFGAYLCIPQLAPDGKIYITTGNSTTYLGRINYPDSLGISCDVAQHSVVLPTYYFNSIPNHPNYFLGKIPGSPCDTITGVGYDENIETKFRIWPNPVSDYCTLWFSAHSSEGLLEVFNAVGQLIFQENISAWSQFKQMDLSNYPTGLYNCRIRWKLDEVSVKIIKE